MPNQPMSAFQQKVLAALTSDFEAEYYIRIKVYPVRKQSSQSGAAYHAHILKALTPLIDAGLVEERDYHGYCQYRKKATP